MATAIVGVTDSYPDTSLWGCLFIPSGTGAAATTGKQNVT